MDDFRAEQKRFNGDGGPSHGIHTYGCPCCQVFHTKKKTRTAAKRKFRVKTKKFLDNWEDYY